VEGKEALSHHPRNCVRVSMTKTVL